MKIFRILSVPFIAVVILATSLIAHLHATEIPTEDVADKVKVLWVGNSLNDLKTYLGNVEVSYPDFVPAIAASAFYDYIFCGKLNQAKEKLVRLKLASDSDSKSYSDEFRTTLLAAIRDISDEIRIQTEHGKGEQDWQSNANPQAVRADWSEHLLPVLDLLTASPKVVVQK